MRLMTLAALSAVSLATLPALTPASAQTPRAYYRGQTETITIIDQNGRRHTRITVRPRSFLDGGTASVGYDQHYTDYYVSPETYPGEYYLDRTDHNKSWSRMPFPTCFDLPGF